MLICLAATSTPFAGLVPRTSNAMPVMTRRPQKTSALQRRDIHTVTARGSASAGRNTIASVAETSANQSKKIAERRNVTEGASSARCGARLAALVLAVKGRAIDRVAQGAREILGVFALQHAQRARVVPPARKVDVLGLDGIGFELDAGHRGLELGHAARHVIARGHHDQALEAV